MEYLQKTCGDCEHNKKDCKKGSMYHNCMLSYGVCALTENQVETPDANDCSFFSATAE